MWVCHSLNIYIYVHFFLLFTITLYFSRRRWTCTTTMSQTRTATVALATTVSLQLNLYFCILPLPPVFSSFLSIFLTSPIISLCHPSPSLLSHFSLLSAVFIYFLYHHFKNNPPPFSPCLFSSCWLFSFRPNVMAVGTKWFILRNFSSTRHSNPTSELPG